MRSKFSWLLIIIAVALICGVFWKAISHTGSVILNPRGGQTAKKELPYEKDSFENLARRGGIASQIEVVGNKFYYQSEGKRISGEINFPATPNSNKMPVVVLARGYVDKEIYKTGIGTHNAAMVYAKAGYITLAPDFSGYGESDPEDENALGARLSKPVEILDLLASLKTLPAQAGLPQTDLDKVYLWGHSNGGQIMLSVSEIVGMKSIVGVNLRGVTLWAPVSKPFPYNILYYSDEADDQGKWLRSQVAQFEKDYDVYNYSIDHYLDKIVMPIQLHQGSNDEAVPKKWSDDLVKSLNDNEKEINYFIYQGADHNMKPAWDMVVSRDVEWFNQLAKEAK